MKKLLILLIVLSFSITAYAKLPVQKTNNLPQGVFKKTRNGNIVQYDAHGKKTGIYKIKNGKAVKIK